MSSKPKSSHVINYWSNILDEWRSSGLKALPWCKQFNISYQSFLHWRKKLSPLPDSFIELFEPEAIQSENSGIELELNAVLIRLERDFDCSTLQRCLKAIKESQC